MNTFALALFHNTPREVLSRQYSKMGAKGMVKQYNISLSAVYASLRMLGITKGKQGTSKLAPEDVRVIKKVVGIVPDEVLARGYMVSITTIGDIGEGETWTEV